MRRMVDREGLDTTCGDPAGLILIHHRHMDGVTALPRLRLQEVCMEDRHQEWVLRIVREDMVGRIHHEDRLLPCKVDLAAASSLRVDRLLRPLLAPVTRHPVDQLLLRIMGRPDHLPVAFPKADTILHLVPRMQALPTLPAVRMAVLPTRRMDHQGRHRMATRHHASPQVVDPSLLDRRPT